jgi:ribosomal protein L3 glutamine methyltransferase
MNVADELITVGDFVRWCATELGRADVHFGHGTDNAWDEALNLVCGAIGIPWDKLEFVLASRLTSRERRALVRMLELRISRRIPVPYLTGEAWFAGHRFLVEPGVLIPRSPIGELIAKRFAPWLAQEPQRILDLCAGSGCIGIACAYAFPDAEVVLADIDPRAVQLASKNVGLHQLGDQVRVVETDLFRGVPEGAFDLIVANPPYVDAEELAQMPEEFTHEPRIALESGVDGLDVVRRLLADARGWLADDGMLVVEVGNSADALVASFPGLPLIWPDLGSGGRGVFIIDRPGLLAAD